MNDEYAFHKFVTNTHCNTDEGIVYKYEVQRIFVFTSIVKKLIRIYHCENLNTTFFNVLTWYEFAAPRIGDLNNESPLK